MCVQYDTVEDQCVEGPYNGALQDMYFSPSLPLTEVLFTI
jgi:hypothetical protein